MKLKLQTKNALNIVKRVVFKEIIKLTLLKRFAIVFFKSLNYAYFINYIYLL